MVEKCNGLTDEMQDLHELLFASLWDNHVISLNLIKKSCLLPVTVRSLRRCGKCLVSLPITKGRLPPTTITLTLGVSQLRIKRICPGRRLRTFWNVMFFKSVSAIIPQSHLLEKSCYQYHYHHLSQF